MEIRVIAEVLQRCHAWGLRDRQRQVAELFGHGVGAPFIGQICSLLQVGQRLRSRESVDGNVAAERGERSVGAGDDHACGAGARQVGLPAVMEQQRTLKPLDASAAVTFQADAWNVIGRLGSCRRAYAIRAPEARRSAT